jgi:hypothetical protein
MTYFSNHPGRWLTQLYWEKKMKPAAGLGETDEKSCAESVRYATAALIAESGVARWGGSFAFVSVATGVDFPDALGGGVGSGAESGPILLTRPTSLSQASADSIDASEPDLRTIHVLGGASAVSDAVIDDIEGLAH